MKVARCREDMLARAHYVLSILAPWIDRGEILGSLRRGKPEVNDIELLVAPRFEDVPAGLFGESEPVNVLAREMKRILDAGGVEHRYDVNGRGSFGERYMRINWVVPEGPELPEERVPVDLFVCLPPAQWGVLKMIRTGPADFSKRLVTPRPYGMLPMGMRVQDGQIIDRGQPIETPDEETFFAQIGIDYIRPEDRA